MGNHGSMVDGNPAARLAERLYDLLQLTRGNVVSGQVPLPAAFQQRECFHAATLLARGMINPDDRVSRDRRSSSLLFSSALQIARAHAAELFAKSLKGRLRFVERGVVAPFIRGFMVKLFVASRVDVFDRCLQHRLCSRRHAAATYALTAGERKDTQSGQAQE